MRYTVQFAIIGGRLHRSHTILCLCYHRHSDVSIEGISATIHRYKNNWSEQFSSVAGEFHLYHEYLVKILHCLWLVTWWFYSEIYCRSQSLWLKTNRFSLAVLDCYVAFQQNYWILWLAFRYAATHHAKLFIWKYLLTTWRESLCLSLKWNW